MKINKSSLLGIVLFSSIANATTLQELKDALAKYCVPYDGSSCNSSELAKYNINTGSCDCNGDYVWSSSARICEKIECPDGYELEFVEDASTCPDGWDVMKEYK